ncbi:TonB-linked outer membrane protein, SusC/RagA family [Chitinophaga sp. CF118]|uniref:SusC/RagA family TonB-linked outer membrane protein n=1 Tax=Chitinophaga sp. CF118 TaxID=1884367 RepID=UPI0008EF64B3|nr:TonB-dependent receptor [Chitinophaga sp. CF118]SFD80113.1 TonB-linked outer membrane protein, SusC/RagA family [Chitinophaga sp. CF118]
MGNFLTLWRKQAYSSCFKLILFFIFSCHASVLYAQQAVSGRVSSGDTSLPGVIVYVKGTSVNTQTDNNGRFSINAPGNATLSFSLMGYGTREIPINNRTTVNAELESVTTGLGEVVVVGYGTQKRKDLTGSIATLNATTYKDQPVLSASSALQGRVAGVSVANSSGAPGGAVKIRIRGANSINASNDPLYVIDGVALSSIGIQDINVNDIESMEVLKDASATAIYGSRGANGVIIITTKSGKAGITKIEYNGFISSNRPMKKYKLLDAVGYAEQANHITGASVFADPQSYAGKGTDWQDKILHDGITQNHQLSVSGGTEKSKYYISGYYVNQSGLLLNTNQEKFAVRANLDSKLSNKVSIGLGLFAAHANSHNNGDIGGKGNPVTAALAWAPTEQVYDSGSQYNRFGISPIWSNPYMTIKERNSDNSSNSAVLNGRLKYNITDWLTFNINVGLDMNITRNAYLNNDWISPGNPGSGQSSTETYTFQNSNALTFHKKFNEKHDLTVMGIVEETSNRLNSFSATGSGLTSTSNGYYNLALNTSQGISSTYSNWALLSYVGRASYTFNDKYLITATYRADGSSKFQSTANKWGYFPSIGAGWRMSEEQFIKDLGIFSNLKLRGSWGITGNQSINPYSSLGLLSGVQYSFGTSTLYQGYMLGSPSNPNLKWETTKQTDIGLDMGFMNGRINVTADYYNKRTEDLLLQVPIASYDGGGTVYKNVGAVNNKGFEIYVDVAAIQTKDFSWTATINASTYKNRVESLGKDSILYRPIIGGGLINTNIQVVKTGQSLGSFYLIPWQGVYQDANNTLGYKAGDNRYVDVSGNGSIGYEDRVIAGSAIPKFQWGFNNNFRYKNLELNVFVQASHGNKIFNATYAGIAAPTSDVKYPTLAESANYWTAKNTGSVWADPASTTNRSYVESTQYLQNGSYVRLKNVSLSYTLHKKTTRFADVRFTLSGQNLYTITKYKGYDPEATSTAASSDADAGIDLGAYPSPRTITFGVNISL